MNITWLIFLTTYSINNKDWNIVFPNIAKGREQA